MSYHTIIFAPDTLQPDGGPCVEIRESGYAGTGTQTTLSIPDPEPVLYDHRDEPIFYANPRPGRRAIGFRSE